MDTPEPFDNPTALGNNIFLYEPLRGQRRDTNQESRAADSPSLLILCTWLGGASTRRIDKYISSPTGYRQQYPWATILLIRTVLLDLTARSFSALRSRLASAREAINGVLRGGQDTVSGRGTTILHIFSHGGCNTAIQLFESMTSEERELIHKHLRLVIFDCCPGNTSFESAYQAALLSMPQQMPHYTGGLGNAAVYAVISVIHTLQTTGMMRSVEHLRRQLNESELFGRGAHRLYLFSDGDRLVTPEDVISHAQEAQQQYHVSTERFREAPHCALVLEDVGRYWSIIRDHWLGGGRASSKI